MDTRHSAARGIVYGVIIGVVAFWVPIAAVALVLKLRAG